MLAGACLANTLSKTSQPILHRGDAEVQSQGMVCSPLRAGVSRADLAARPESYRPRPYGRGYGARPLWVVKSACYALPTLTALRQRWPRAQSAQRRSESAGRAVHCAPVWVVLTWLLGRNPGVRALTGAATTRATLQGRSKAPCVRG